MKQNNLLIKMSKIPKFRWQRGRTERSCHQKGTMNAVIIRRFMGYRCLSILKIPKSLPTIKITLILINLHSRWWLLRSLECQLKGVMYRVMVWGSISINLKINACLIISSIKICKTSMIIFRLSKVNILNQQPIVQCAMFYKQKAKMTYF